MRDPLGGKRSRHGNVSLLAAGSCDLEKDHCHPALRLEPRRSAKPCACLEIRPAEANNRCVSAGRATAAHRTCWLPCKYALGAGA
jgi:hypothetical protein